MDAEDLASGLARSLVGQRRRDGDVMTGRTVHPTAAFVAVTAAASSSGIDTGPAGMSSISTDLNEPLLTGKNVLLVLGALLAGFAVVLLITSDTGPPGSAARPRANRSVRGRTVVTVDAPLLAPPAARAHDHGGWELVRSGERVLRLVNHTGNPAETVHVESATTPSAIVASNDHLAEGDAIEFSADPRDLLAVSWINGLTGELRHRLLPVVPGSEERTA